MCSNYYKVLHEIWTIFRGDIAKCISGNLAVESILKFTVFSKLKTEKTNLIGKYKMWLDLKVNISNSQNRSAVVVYDELGSELEHLNWALFSVLSPTAVQILYSQFANLFTLKTEKGTTCM